MQHVNKQEDLQFLINAVEEKVGWGSSNTWVTQDFQRLSELILEDTDVLLSVSTLKRVFGKVSYHSSPSMNTLDTLAGFIGEKHWRSFQQRMCEPIVEIKEKLEENASSMSFEQIEGQKAPIKRKAILAFLILIPIALISLIPFYHNDAVSNPSSHLLDAAEFGIKRVTEGLPNTVVFNYDVSAIKGDRFQIQQYWDPSKRINLDTQNKVASCFYQYPGYFRAKLVMDNQIIKEEHLYIPSNGWLAAIEREPYARYILEEEMIFDEAMGVSSSVYTEIQNEEELNWLSFFYVEEADQTLERDHFDLKTSLRNTLVRGDNLCQATKIKIIGTEGVLNLPFTSPGCVGEIGLYLNEVRVDAKEHDFSEFGCDFSAPVSIRVLKEGSKLAIYREGNPIFEHQDIPDMGMISGVKISFRGVGEISDLTLDVGEHRVIGF